MHERYSYYRNIAYISVIFGGYVLIWYSRGDGSSFVPTEYSCAVTPQIRQMGNHLSGNAGTAYASLLA